MQGFIGCICTDLNVNEAIASAASQAQAVCRQIYGTSPEVHIEADRQILMPYHPGHLDYMLFELFKNSMRAIMEKRMTSLPGIHAKICESTSEITIR